MPVLSGDIGTRIPSVERIAVLRANALGDYLFAVPALDALRAAYPRSEIVLLGADWHHRLLTGRPGPVDRVVPVPPSPGINDPHGEATEDPAKLAAFFMRMKAEQFDLAVQMHGGGRNSNPFVRRLGARCSAGLRAPDAAPLERNLPYVYYQHEIVRLLEVVGLVGAGPVSLEPTIALTRDDVQEADEALGRRGEPFVVLHPGATDPRRRWPADRFAAVGDALWTAGLSVVVSGSGAEAPLVAEVMARMSAPATPLVDAVGIGGLAAVCARSRLVVSNDTGPRHLAQAVGTPTVAVYWCGNLVTAGPLTRRRHRPHISWTVHCPVCHASCVGTGDDAGRCGHDPSFVASVPVAPVVADALELARPGGPAGPLG